MGRRAVPKIKKNQQDSQLKDTWVNKAAEEYVEDRELLKENRRGLSRICQDAVERCYAETKKKIKVPESTVWDRARGVQSIRDFNSQKRWLTEEEEEVVVDFAVDAARRGFPLNHRRLKEHVDAICRARLGSQFPEKGVGHEWTYRFVTRHSTRLHPYWTHSLDESRARAVNPHTTQAYFDLLESTLQGEDGEDPISEDCIYGMDETGVQQGVGVKERVFGPAGQKVQYQQRSGDRENITVVVTICADGTSIPPTVIYKGDAFMTKWHQNNPLKASLGHSPNGYVDGAIGVEWIKQFDEHTRDKANGRRRLLLVDGHSSHYSYTFLEYARQHHIHVLCYPSHSTHTFQGLDVVIFSVLKREWTKARDSWESRKGQKVSKSNFLEVYAQAHVKALTSSNIKAAFRATGVVPFNRDVISAAMMAPSLESSCHGSLPLRQGSPILAISQAISEEMSQRVAASSDPIAGPSQLRTPQTPRTPTRRFNITDALTGTSASHLVSPSPIPPTFSAPRYVPTTLSPAKRRHADLLSREPATEFEAALLAALRDTTQREVDHKKNMIAMQAGLVLQAVYCDRAQEKMEGMDEKEKQRGKKKARLMGDGLPRVLTHDNFFTKVTEFEEQQRQKEQDKEKRKRGKQVYDDQVAAWKTACVKRNERVAAQRERFAKDTSSWMEERDAAKREGRKPSWDKPKLGRLEALPPKPRLRVAKEGPHDEEGSEEDADEDEDEQ